MTAAMASSVRPTTEPPGIPHEETLEQEVDLHVRDAVER